MKSLNWLRFLAQVADAGGLLFEEFYLNARAESSLNPSENTRSQQESQSQPQSLQDLPASQDDLSARHAEANYYTASPNVQIPSTSHSAIEGLATISKDFPITKRQLQNADTQLNPRGNSYAI